METNNYSKAYNLDQRMAEISYDIDMAMFKTLKDLPGREFTCTIGKHPLATFKLDPENPGRILKVILNGENENAYESDTVFNDLPVDYKLQELHGIEEKLKEMDEMKTFNEISDEF